MPSPSSSNVTFCPKALAVSIASKPSLVAGEEWGGLSKTNNRFLILVVSILNPKSN